MAMHATNSSYILLKVKRSEGFKVGKDELIRGIVLISKIGTWCWNNGSLPEYPKPFKG